MELNKERFAELCDLRNSEFIAYQDLTGETDLLKVFSEATKLIEDQEVLKTIHRLRDLKELTWTKREAEEFYRNIINNDKASVKDKMSAAEKLDSLQESKSDTDDEVAKMMEEERERFEKEKNK